jgi:hypothetical protein
MKTARTVVLRPVTGRVLPFCLVAMLLAVPLAAQSVVVPTANWTTRATALLNSLTRESARTVQQGISASELAGLPVGAPITGISFRMGITTSNPASWPVANATWKNYDIALAEAAVPISQFSTTFANNMKNPVLVRQGPLVMPAGTYLNPNHPTAPNPFDTFYFAFQKPYVYQGGDLVIHVTHDGNDQSSAVYLEGLAATSNPPGLTMYASSYQAAIASVSSTTFMVVRIHYGFGDPVCAGSGGFQPLLVLSHNLANPTPPPGKVNFAVTNAVGGAPGFLMVGIARVSFPLPNGCRLLVAPIQAIIPFWLSGSGPGQGRWDVDLPFPANVMGSFEIQAAVLDNGAPGGYVGSNGVSFILKP